MPINPNEVKWDETPQINPAEIAWDEPKQQEQPTGGIGERLLRQAGLTGRAALTGLGDVANIVGGPVASLTGIRRPSDISEDIANRIGLPLPQSGTERFVQSAGRGVVGAGAMMGAGGALSGAGGNVGRFGKVLASNPSGQLAGSLGAAAGAELGNQVGLEGYAQLAPAILGAATAQGLTNAAKRVPITIGAIGGDDYVVPPSQTKKPTAISRGMEILSGKAKTEQFASAKNQAITNQRVLADLGMPKDTQLSPEVLQAYRNSVFDEGYRPIMGSGVVTPDAALQGKLIDIAKPHMKQLKDFPNSPVARSVYTEVKSLFDASRSPFNADTAMNKIKELRELASKAYKADESSLGKSYKDMANAMEDQLGRHLEKTGAPADTIKAFKTARQNIAKSHSVEEAMVGSPETGYNINARKLSQMKQGGAPLTGGMKRAADYASAYPKSMTIPVAGATNPYTLTDLYTGGTLGGVGAGLSTLAGLGPVPGAAMGIAGNALRPVARGLAMSQPWQKGMMQQSEQSTLANLLYSIMATNQQGK